MPIGSSRPCQWDRGNFRQPVLENDADAVTLVHFNRGAGDVAVEAPGVDGPAGKEFGADDFGV